MLRIDVRSSRELQALVLSLRHARTEVQKQVREQTRTVVRPEWQRAVAENVTTPLERRVLYDTARATVTNQNVRLSAAGARRRLSGGLIPSEHYGAVEFGMPADRMETVTRGGTTYQRRSGGKFRPRNRKGYVIYPALKNITPRIVSLWVQTAVRVMHEAFERKL